MYVTWRERLSNQPALRELQMWPFVDPDEVPKKYRSVYIRNRRLAAEVLKGRLLKDVAADFQLSTGFISQLMSRCLAGNDTDEPVLTRGLIPYTRIGEAHRKTPLDELGNRSGHQYSFQCLLTQVPGLKLGLDKLLFSGLKRKANAQVASVAALFGEFKRLLVEAQWPKTQYPYTTDNMAYESIRRYYHERTRQFKQEIRKDPKRIITPLHTIYRPFNCIEIDSQITDLNTTIHVQLNDEIEPVRVSRVNLLLAICSSSKAVIGYYLALNDSPNQDDMLQLIDNIRRTWSPVNLSTPGLNYVLGSGFPSMWGDVFNHITMGHVKLDNALMHLASTVRHECCYKLGATLNLGLPATPLGRNFVEEAFAQINQTTHRFPSTTGSYPTDPIKETSKNRKKPPLVTLKAFEEILSVQIAAYNVLPHQELNNESPLHMIQRQSNQHYIRWLPLNYDEMISPFQGESIHSVIYLKNENRNPFIRFAYKRYKGPCLNDLAGTKTDKVRIKYDRRAIRHVYAYTLEGEYLGVLSAPKSWQRFEHSIQTAKAIHKEYKKLRRHTADPLADYFHYMAENRHSPSCALELIRLVRESGRISLFQSEDIQVQHAIEEYQNTKEENKDTNYARKVTSKIKAWHSSFAHQVNGDKGDKDEED